MTRLKHYLRNNNNNDKTNENKDKIKVYNSNMIYNENIQDKINKSCIELKKESN